MTLERKVADFEAWIKGYRQAVKDIMEVIRE